MGLELVPLLFKRLNLFSHVKFLALLHNLRFLLMLPLSYYVLKRRNLDVFELTVPLDIAHRILTKQALVEQLLAFLSQ